MSGGDVPKRPITCSNETSLSHSTLRFRFIRLISLIKSYICVSYSQVGFVVNFMFTTSKRVFDKNRQMADLVSEPIDSLAEHRPPQRSNP